MPLTNAPPNATNSKKPLNKYYEFDVENFIRYSRCFLRVIGVWPMISKNCSTREKIISKLMIVICFFALNFTIVPVSLDTILREKNTFIIFTRLLAPIGATVALVLKYIGILFRRENIRICIEHMERDWRDIKEENERSIMMKNIDIGRRLTLIACSFMYSSTTFYLSVTPILMGTKINERNETVRPLIYPGYDFFVDTQKSPAYEIVYFAICATNVIRYTVTMTAYNLAVVFVTHACGQIQIITSRLQRLFDDIDDEKSSYELEKRISSVIHCHVRGLRFSTKIDDVLREICFIEVVAAMLILCLIEYNTQKALMNIHIMEMILAALVLGSYIFNVFMFCYVGELLKEQVAKSAYAIEWYRLPGKTALAVVLMIAIANIPRKITAGRMMDLSMASFGLIMRTSAAYVNMIRTMAQ